MLEFIKEQIVMKCILNKCDIRPSSNRSKIWLVATYAIVGLIACFFPLENSMSGDDSSSGGIDGMQPTGTINGHQWIDLGLSVKWATCNVGASSPSEYGNYYAWGETRPKSEYTEDNCFMYGVNMGDISGDVRYDAARANWGGSWRLPTKAEMEELIEKCSWQWTAQGGHKGYRVTGPNGSSIFMPAAGDRAGSSLYDAEDGGIFWSSTPVEDDTRCAYGLYCFSQDRHDWGFYFRYGGASVRPVSD